MVINLCLPQFRPRIYCNKISADGYEVENLISEDLTKRSHGFRTEYFIKPPVYVTVSFPFNVEICRINIDLTAGGGQNVTGLEMYTSALSSRVSWNTPECQTPGPDEPSIPEKEAFTLVGKVLLKNQSQVVFSHRGFKARPPFGPMEATLPSPAVVAQELWNKGALSLSHVAHLKICITHVTGSGIPCIKRLEVWGQPAKTCSQEVIDSVLLVASESLPQDLSLQAPALPMESDCDPGGQSEGQQAPSSLLELAEKRKMEQGEHAPDSSLGLNASCFSTTSLLVSPTTSEHTAKKMKAASELMDCSTGPVSHEQKLSQSLEIALTSTLGSMPSFTARLTRGQLQHLSTRGSNTSWRPGSSSEQPGSILGPECTSCKRVFSPYFKKEPVYQLPCGHLLCRPCLGEKQRSLPMTCIACQRPFASQDVLRVHF
ncbi:RING finger protein 37 isoform X4 [Delphinus delphis]|uniref:RING finger protein 37 isoform X4 n=1 Tax=Delphinus delphis TaxID=9728 RepID=UPI003750743D